MIDLTRGFVFIHIGNCAGTSIEYSLRAPSTELVPWDNKGATQHLTYSEIKRWYLVRASRPGPIGKHLVPDIYAKFDSLFKFTVIRNPWDRMVAKYRHEARPWNQWLEICKSGVKAGPSFKEFLLGSKDWNVHDLNDPLFDHRHWAPFLNWFGKDDLNFYIGFDNLDEDYQKVCGILGIQDAPLKDLFPDIGGPIRAPNRKLDERGNARRHYSYYYDQESIDFIAKRFKEDIDFFGFEFEDKRHAK